MQFNVYRCLLRLALCSCPMTPVIIITVVVVVAQDINFLYIQFQSFNDEKFPVGYYG